jgi:hypothetical protein
MAGRPRTPSGARWGLPLAARLRRGGVAALLAVAAIGAPAALAPAALGAGSPVLADCNLHLHLTRPYSIAQLQYALRVMPADMAQYTDCPYVIRQALDSQLAAARRGLLGADVAPPGGAGVPEWLIAIFAVVLASGAGATLTAWRRQRGRRAGARPEP